MSKILVSLTLGLAGAGLLASRLYHPISIYDEGLVLGCASRVLHGELPYRDFWSLYAPGQFYALASVFALFGESVLTERLWDLAIKSLLAVACFWLVRGVSSRGVAVLCFAAVSTWLCFFGMPGYPVYPYLLCAVLSLGALMRGGGEDSKTWACLGGLLAGLSAIFRHDMGIMMIGAVGLALVVLAIHSRWHRQPDARARGRLALLFPVWAALPPVIAYGALWLLGCGPEMIEQLFRDARSVPAFRGLPYPDPLQVLNVFRAESLGEMGHQLVYAGLPVVAPLLLLLAGVRGGMALWRSVRIQPGDQLILLLAAVGAGAVPQAAMRSDFKHFLPMGLVAIVAFYVMAARIKTRSPHLRLAIILAGSIYWFIPLGTCAGRLSGEIPGLPPDVRDTVTYLREHHAGEPLYVGVENHDRFVINAAALYFLADAQYGTKYNWLDPGVTTMERIQTEMIGELDRLEVPVVVLSGEFWEEPNESSRDQGIDLLDRYISENFQSVARFGEYRILERRTGPSGAPVQESSP